MIIKNTIDQNISVVIEGTVYDLPAMGTLKGVPAKHAEYWKNSLHTFIVLEDEKVSQAKAVVTETEQLEDEPAEPKSSKKTK